MNIGVTGATGFIGWHVRAGLFAGDHEFVPITRDAFEHPELLSEKLSSVDALVHLAGGRRENDEENYSSNVELAQKLVQGLTNSAFAGPVVYVSSAAEEGDTGYGRGKREAGEILQAWADSVGSSLTTLVLPSIFGEFAPPNHHSMVSTLAHDLVVGTTTAFTSGARTELLHVTEAVRLIMDRLERPTGKKERVSGISLTVDEVQEKLAHYLDSYRVGVFPRLDTDLERRLFNTLYSAGFHSLAPVKAVPRTDARGTLIEKVRTLSPGQCFISTTNPGSVRGDHYHVRKIERFMVVAGEAVIRLRKLFDDQVLTFNVSGKEPVYIDMPTFYTHNIENTGDEVVTTLFWTNELYDTEDPDTFSEKIG